MAGTISVWRAETGRTVRRMDLGDAGREKEWRADRLCRVIGEGAFRNNTKVRRVILPENVREIGIQSFGNASLRLVDMQRVETIRKEAFYNCAHLNRLYIPKSVSFIGKKAFARCRRLEQVRLERGSACREIKQETFAECSSLSEVFLPNTISRISEKAFYKCTALKEIKLPAGLREIGREAFYQTGLTELILPEKLLRIGDSAFLKCNQLEYVRIPESVKFIEKWAFHGCNRLKVLEIAHDPEEIGPWIINRSARIRCRKGGAVERYCREAGFQMEYLEV